MAKKYSVQYIDDIDGTVLDSVETIRFSIDGHLYEFDTSPTNARLFRKAISRYVDISRTIQAAGQATKLPTKVPDRRPKEQLDAIRSWANRNGFEVSARGRVPNTVLRAFQEAH